MAWDGASSWSLEKEPCQDKPCPKGAPVTLSACEQHNPERSRPIGSPCRARCSLGLVSSGAQSAGAARVVHTSSMGLGGSECTRAGSQRKGRKQKWEEVTQKGQARGVQDTESTRT